MSRGKIHRGQRVYENNQIAREVIDFHAEPSPAGPFKQKSEILSINKLRYIKWIASFPNFQRILGKNTQARFDNVGYRLASGDWTFQAGCRRFSDLTVQIRRVASHGI